MEILVKINRKQALMEGRDVNSSTGKISFVPADLTEVQRVVIAGTLEADGYTSSISLVDASLEALVEYAQAEVDKREARAADRRKEQEKDEARLREWLADPPMTAMTVGFYLSNGGEIGHNVGRRRDFTTEILVYAEPPFSLYRCSKEAVDEYREWVGRVVNPYQRAQIEACYPEAREALAELKREEGRKREENKAREGRVEGFLRGNAYLIDDTAPERLYAGLLSDKELRKGVHDALVRAAGYDPQLAHIYLRPDTATTSSAKEWRALKEEEKVAPKGAKVVVVETYHREADTDEADMADGDNEIEHKERFVRVSWIEGGCLPVSALVPIKD